MKSERECKQKRRRPAPVIESLEARILLSADLPGLDLPAIDPDFVDDADVARILAQAGFADVRVVRGGMTAWLGFGWPVEEMNTIPE